MARRGQAGLNSLQLVLLLLVGGALYGAVKFGPPYIRNYQLENAFDDEARRAHLVSDEELKLNVLRKAHEIGFPDWIDERIVVRRNGETRRIAVSAEYDWPVELLFGKVVAPHFAPSVDRPIESR